MPAEPADARGRCNPQKLTGQFIKSTQRLPVKISVANKDGLLKVGMLAVVRIKRNSP